MLKALSIFKSWYSQLKKTEISSVGLAIVGVIFAAAVIIAVYGSFQYALDEAVENIVLFVIQIAINLLYLIASGLIVLGSILVTIRYVKSKVRAPFVPFAGLPRARYLTISLEIFIGAEIIKTVIARSYEEFILLALTIGIRGLVAAILYLEHKWHSEEHVHADHMAKMHPDMHPDHTEPIHQDHT